MTVKEMYQTALELVGLETMPEDSGIIYDNGKEVKKVLAGIEGTFPVLIAGNRAAVRTCEKILTEAGKQVIVRIPLIPGVNDAPDEIEKLGDVIGTLGSGVQAVEVLKYNYLAETKYQSIGLTWENFGKRTQSDEKLEHIRQQLKTITGLEII